MPRSSLLGLLLFLLAGMQLSCTPTTNPDMASSPAPRNIILFIADGAGPTHFTTAREIAAHIGLRDRLRGHLDNTDVGKRLFEALALEPAVLPANGRMP